MQFSVEAKTRRWQDDCIVVPTHTQTRTFPIMCGPCGLGWAGLAGDDIHQETIRQSSNSFSCQSEISRSDVLMLGCPLSYVQLCPGNNIRQDRLLQYANWCFTLKCGDMPSNNVLTENEIQTGWCCSYFWKMKNIIHRSKIFLDHLLVLFLMSFILNFD